LPRSIDSDLFAIQPKQQQQQPFCGAVWYNILEELSNGHQLFFFFLFFLSFFLDLTAAAAAENVPLYKNAINGERALLNIL
jgi:hypothetical protein